MLCNDFGVVGTVVLGAIALFFLFMLALTVLVRIADFVDWIFGER